MVAHLWTGRGRNPDDEPLPQVEVKDPVPKIVRAIRHAKEQLILQGQYPGRENKKPSGKSAKIGL
jgi:hypothetical protein